MTSTSASMRMGGSPRPWQSISAPAIEELRPLFVEEATQLEDIGELAYLRSKTKVAARDGGAIVHEVRLQRVLHPASGRLHSARCLPRRRYPRAEENRIHGRDFPH